MSNKLIEDDTIGYEKEKSAGRNVEMSKKLTEDNTIKDTDEESKSLQGEPEAER